MPAGWRPSHPVECAGWRPASAPRPAHQDGLMPIGQAAIVTPERAGAQTFHRLQAASRTRIPKLPRGELADGTAVAWTDTGRRWRTVCRSAYFERSG
jgi:hypothetical protein